VRGTGQLRDLADAMGDRPIGAAIRAAAERRIALGLLIRREGAFPGALIKASESRCTPILLIVGDDPELGESTGPDGWACARRLSGWARHVTIHGAGAEVAHYQAAVKTAELHRAAVLVETSSPNAQLWSAFLRARSKVVILPRAGVHPMSPVLH
jgi:hypothetical protein